MLPEERQTPVAQLTLDRLSLGSIPEMTDKVKPPVVLLMGPTATGKTELALELHRSLACDIVSVDSALVYREMNIGTAKPGRDQLAECPHRLIDIVDPPGRTHGVVFDHSVVSPDSNPSRKSEPE